MKRRKKAAPTDQPLDPKAVRQLVLALRIVSQLLDPKPRKRRRKAA
jgi:hypothetical protein